MDPIARRDSPAVIPLSTHSVLDYVLGAALIFSPYVFGFSDVNSARDVFLVLGFLLIGYSLITNYRYSLFKLLPLGAHMTFDVIVGICLILAPSAFGYIPLLSGFQYGLHYLFGLGAVALVTLTRPKTDRARMGMETPTVEDRGGIRRRAA